MMSIQIIYGYEKPEKVRVLFSEYIQMLISNDESFKEYLDIQNYDEEINDLEKKYGTPDGRLYLLYYDKELAGCIGLRKIDDENCEMKRLYIRQKFRGKNLGNILVKKIITEARDIGYSYMLLDTLPFLKSAIRLYENYGFYKIERYNNNPMDNSIYMKLNL